MISVNVLLAYLTTATFSFNMDKNLMPIGSMSTLDNFFKSYIMRYSFIFLFAAFIFQDLQADCIQGDCKNGKGVYEYSSGARYEGEFVNGELHGYGIFYYTNGNRYEGYWEGNYKNGEGKMFYASGEFYEGNWYRDRRTGHGEYTFKNGDRYIGEWHWDRPNGEGELRFVNGAHYIGGFKNGKFHGQGTFRDGQGKIFSGEWTEGKLPGFNAPKEETPPADEVVKEEGKENGTQSGDEVSGTQTEASSGETEDNTERQRPEEAQAADAGVPAGPRKPVEPNWELVRDCFMEKCMEGLGYITYSSGSRYFGSFINGQPEGEGTCFYSNGDVYTGGWRNHRPEGDGTMFYADGRILSAEWKAGKTVRVIERKAEPVEQPKIKREPDPVTRIWAVLVGVARYDHLPALKYSDDDAWRMYAFLKSPEGGALPDDQIRILIDEDATREKILESIRSTFDKADDNDVVILYMSGHGIQGDFAPIDYDGYRNALSYQEIHDLLAGTEARHKVVFADACYAGSLLGSRGTEEQIARLYESLANSSDGVAFMLSSKDAETSLEDQGLRQGVYSHFLMRGMKGEADEDRDGLVSLKELFHFVYTGVRKYTANAQTPVLAGQFDPAMPVSSVRY